MSAKNEKVNQAMTLARSVAATATKVEIYQDDGREPPEALLNDLAAKEGELDDFVKKLLAEEPNLKGALLEHEKLTEECAAELEWSYRRATCFMEDQDGQHSRMFFLPFLYIQDEDGGKHGVIEFEGQKLETLKHFISDFAARNFGWSGMTAPEVRMYPRPIFDWVISEEEEKFLPRLHEAVLGEEEMTLTGMFKSHAKLSSVPEGDESSVGWSVGVICLSLVHEDMDFLEEVNFAEMEEEFEEEFEEIFDPGSENDYRAPIDPVVMSNEGTKQLWLKQVDIGMAELAKVKKPKHLGLIEATFVWDDGFLHSVVLDFSCGEDDQPPSFHRRVTRGALINEDIRDLSAYLVGHEGTMRGDFKTIFGHMSVEDLDMEDADDEDD